MKRHTLQLLLLTALSTSVAMAQINCNTGASAQKLVCEFPFSTGALNNASTLGSSSVAQNATVTATAINTGIATQLSQLPLASASAGTIEVYKAGVPETFTNLGPILVDRAQVIGKGKIFLGVTASQFVFTDIDGIALSNLPFSYSQTAYYPGTSNPLSTTYTTENTNLSFRMDQLVSVGTVGLSNRVDLSVIVPVQRVSLGASANDSQSYVQNAGSTVAYGPINNTIPHTAGTASGIGDITFNGKGELWAGERAAFSGGLTVRTPTGDALNFLGSGSWGFDLYTVYSYLAKISPHAKIGYRWNTTTELYNPTDKFGNNQSLPGGLEYDFGADATVSRAFTVAVDALGDQYLNAPIYVRTTIPLTVTTGSSNTPLSLPSSLVENSSYTISNLSTGVKWSPGKQIVISANLLTQLINAGLRSRPTPLLGISCKF
jgi:hypothetical protein